MSYYINKLLDANFEDAILKVTESLKNEGFGIISEIDIQEKLKEKLGVSFRKYKILGACNPSFAYEALQKEDKIGVMLPCNIIVQQTDDGKIDVAAVDPIISMQGVNNSELGEIAMVVREKLIRIITSL